MAQQTIAGASPLASDYMDDTPANENPPKDFNKLDLSQLQGFSFGTQWTQDKTTPSDARERSDRPRRDGPDRRDGGGGPDRRDRRTFRRPMGGEGGGAPAAGPGGGGAESPRRESPDRERGERGPGPRREFQGGPRRDGPGGGRFGGRFEQQDRGPYDSPYFSVAFYPEDTSFSALAKTIRSSCRTIELFEIAKTVIGKADRFVVVLARKTGPSDATATPTEKQPIYLSVPDGIPFESEEAAINHVLSNHLTRFFDLAEVTIDPPKGNFQVINKCGVTGELLGPPNYHRYSHIVQQHFAAKVARMPFEAFRSRIETVRDPEAVAQWLEKMKKTTRYTWKRPSGKTAAPFPAGATTPSAPAATEAPAESAEAPAAPAPDAAPAEAAPAPAADVPTFDNFEDARSYLFANAREKMVRAVENARFHGKLVETMPVGEIRRAVEGALERQRRFPLDTANALRGRLRREHFTIFKKGSKGVSYVCAVKRKFRVPGQTFAETISALITFIEGNPMVRASELQKKFLNIDVAVAPKAPEVAPAPAGETPAAPVAEVPAKVEPVLTIDERARISRMQGDLRWLVTEGYVTEFIDGRLFAPPPMVEARKREVESEEHDPENFPEVPAVETPAPAAPASTAPVEAPVAPVVEAPAVETPAEPVAAEPTAAAAPEVAPEPIQKTETPAAEPPPAS